MEKREYTELPPELVKVKEAGFKVFDSGNYDLNIIGFRTLNDSQGFNQFNDTIAICYKLNSNWIVEKGAATTDPGRYWLTKPDYKACAIMVHGQQYRGVYKIGLHRGKYEALTQCNKIKFWRDGNKDSHLDYSGPIYNSIIGLNIHKSSSRQGGSLYVDKWSAGCQVWQDPLDHERMIQLCKKQVQNLGYHTFSYTLLAGV
tara:strand:- start:1099 stop:1701 length:603 start_codon:yes stop_codon:yes gene_type:complete